MTIASEITRLQNDKAAMCTAIENKWVTVGNVTLDDYASCIDAIQTWWWGSDIKWICYFMVGGWASWNAVCRTNWWWGGWAAAIWRDFITNIYARVVVWCWWASVTCGYWNGWGSSALCYDGKGVTAKWWCVNTTCWASWWTSWSWYEWGVWCTWANLCWWWGGGWACWAWWTTWLSKWWNGWKWVCYCGMQFGWWWGGSWNCANNAAWSWCDGWGGWWCQGSTSWKNATWCWWWGGWSYNPQNPSWAWWWWIVLISYPTDWSWWICDGVWWCKFECWDYTMHCFTQNWYFFPKPLTTCIFNYLVVWGGWSWGKRTCRWWWGWGDVKCWIYSTTSCTHTIVVWCGGERVTTDNTPWNPWWDSCLNEVVAKWWCGWERDWWNSGSWCIWGAYRTTCGSGWWWAWAGWNWNAPSSNDYGGNGWLWLCWYGGWWGWASYRASACQCYRWKWCCWWWNGATGSSNSSANTWCPATTCGSGWWGWWSGGSWAWAAWVVDICYPTDWSFWFTVATWWDSCYTCDWYCVHRFTSNWTFTIVS